MNAQKWKATSLAVILVVLIAGLIPSPVNADGGPIVPHDLWGDLEEGHQTGIVTILDDQNARMDLFISILDSTNVSHEITFFVPIGNNAETFTANERNLYDFDKTYTSGYDQRLRYAADLKQEVILMLFSGALMANGGIFTPLWAPLLLTGCAGASQQAERTLTTDSSVISVYNIDDNTDTADLVKTTGLPSAVAETLAGLKGQRVAIVKLQTQTKKAAIDTENPNPNYTGYTEPGLHLSWMTQLVTVDGQKKVTYPLGTGAAWAKPIKLTRVYVSAPEGLDFSVQYPKLGADRSGYERISGARIYGDKDLPAFSVDEAKDFEGHVWRAVYLQSNPTDNVVVTVKTESGLTSFRRSIRGGIIGYSLVFALAAGTILWVLAWQFLMPWFLKKDPNYVKPNWYHALFYPAVNVVFMVVPGAVFFLFFMMGLPGPALIGQFLVSTGVCIGFFMLVHSKRLGVGRGKGFAAFILTSLCSSAVYLALAAGFAWAVGMI
jgi:hypothetical protein